MNAVVPRTPAEEALGLTLPNRRSEEWKWTDLRRLVAAPYGRQAVIASDADVDRLIAAAPLAV